MTKVVMGQLFLVLFAGYGKSKEIIVHMNCQEVKEFLRERFAFSEDILSKLKVRANFIYSVEHNI